MIRRSVNFAIALFFAMPFFAQAQPLEKVSLRLDWVASGYHAIWYLAVDRGLFKAEGISQKIFGACKAWRSMCAGIT